MRSISAVRFCGSLEPRVDRIEVYEGSLGTSHREGGTSRRVGALESSSGREEESRLALSGSSPRR